MRSVADPVRAGGRLPVGRSALRTPGSGLRRPDSVDPPGPVQLLATMPGRARRAWMVGALQQQHRRKHDDQ
jgi:hypothetical protein